MVNGLEIDDDDNGDSWWLMEAMTSLVDYPTDFSQVGSISPVLDVGIL